MKTSPAQIPDIALASNVLICIFESLRRYNRKTQLFMKINYGSLQAFFYFILTDLGSVLFSDFASLERLKNIFVFSESNPLPFCGTLQEAVEHLQLAGMVCWPDPSEPDLMRLNSSAKDYYENSLLENTPERLAYRDVASAQKFAQLATYYHSDLIVDRPHLMNITS